MVWFGGGGGICYICNDKSIFLLTLNQIVDVKLFKCFVAALLLPGIFVAEIQAKTDVKTSAGDGWTLETSDYNGEYTGAPVANGVIGILPWREPFSVRHVMLNHVFENSPTAGINTVVKGINPFHVRMWVNGTRIRPNNISDWHQKIDMRRAIHTTSFVADGRLDVSYSIIALRNMPYSAMMRINLKALNDVKVDLTAVMDVPEGMYRNASTRLKTVNADGHVCPILHTDAETLYGRYKVTTSSMILPESGAITRVDTVPDATGVTIDLKKGEAAGLTLVASLCTSRDFVDPMSEADRQVIHMEFTGADRLQQLHEHQWADMWQGDIEIDGDDEAQRVVRFALFNLYGFCREGSRLSVSPMGLSSDGYAGHVFWDTEIWMYPPMLFMNQGIARSMMDYRCDRLPAARRRAMASGYRGAMYPWESDDFGEESTPTWATTGSMEHHITADVAIASWNYYRMTGDKDWLRDSGWPVIKDVADFWVSRVEPNDDGSYSIRQVIGADEYAIGVDDNAFTNGSAKIALRNAIAAATILGLPYSDEWARVADGIKIWKNADGVTLEHAAYDGYVIKQADVNLLAYPLGLVTKPEEIEADLEFYLKKLDKVNGPAMSYGIFSVAYSRIGNVAKAEEMFRNSYRPNMRVPFGVFAETSVSQNPYFATGAGSMLQAVINGFGGLELTDNGIVQLKSKLPASWKKLILRGVGPDRQTYTVEQ